jgi:galactokinase
VAMAIDRDVTCTAIASGDDRVEIESDDFDGPVVVDARGHDDPAKTKPEWGRLVGGVVCALAELGRLPAGIRAHVNSTLPIGGGLSSSAAFEVAVALALADAARLTIDPVSLARAAQRAEHLGTGVPCGIQDQMASVMGGVILLDCRTVTVESLTLPDDLAVVIVDSGVQRTLAGSPWAQRRAESFAVAHALGLRVLRDATPEQVADLPRGRHAVSEIRRVRAFAAALRRDDRPSMGELMLASHASSRDDMECSTPELDLLVECLVDAGAYGARLTGGGFGGCCVALADVSSAAAVASDALARYERDVVPPRSASATIARPGAPAGPSHTSITTERAP